MNDAALPRILVVDDDPEVRAVLCELLELEGYPVAGAESGLAALLRIGLERPGCLVLDLKLQDVSGFEIFRTLRDCPVFEDLPVLFISGVYHDDVWIRRQLGSGPFEYLPKPVDQDDLFRVIRSLTDRRLRAA